MKYFELQKINKLTFGHEDIARVLGIALPSARVTANRYVKQGLLIRIKRNLYILKERWETLDREQKFGVANLIQSPSYISLVTALEYYQLTTQMQQEYFESIGLKRSKQVEVETSVFIFAKIQPALYFGFRREQGVFIATPEKAFLDAVYLTSLGRYNFDSAAIDFDKLDPRLVREYAQEFPLKTQKYLERYECFRET